MIRTKHLILALMMVDIQVPNTDNPDPNTGGNPLVTFDPSNLGSDTLESFAATNDDRGVEFYIRSESRPGRRLTIKSLGHDGNGVLNYPLFEIFGDIDETDQVVEVKYPGDLSNGTSPAMYYRKYYLTTEPEHRDFWRFYYAPPLSMKGTYYYLKKIDKGF